MKRYQHWLYPIKSGAQPQALVMLACEVRHVRPESGPVVEDLRLVRWHTASGARQGDDYVKIKHHSQATVSSFWQALKRFAAKHDNLWLACPRAPVCWGVLSLWDMVESGSLRFVGSQNLPAHLKRRASRRQGGGVLVLEDPVNAVAVRFPDVDCRITLVDLRNYGVDLSAETAGAARQVARGWTFLVGMIAALDAGKLGNLQITVSSQAFHAFRHNYLSHSMLAHTHEKTMLLEDQAYKGGRCEALQLGEIQGPVHYLDFYSLYASRCLVEAVPVQLRRYEEYEEPCEALSLRDEYPQTADVLVEVSEPLYPVEIENLLLFPVGTFRTVLTGPELAHAFQRGHVQRVYRAAWYHCRPALRLYAEHFLQILVQLRRDGLSDMAAWVKRLLVGLVGKLGQRGREWVDDPTDSWVNPWDSCTVIGRDGSVTRYRVLAGRRQREVEQLWAPDAIPAAAAWITSSARWELTKAFAVAEWKNCYYGDTDSVFTNERGYEELCKANMVAPDEPGKLRLVQTAASAVIFGWKSYVCGDRQACSGVPKGTVDMHQSTFYSWLTQWIATALRSKSQPAPKRILTRRHTDRPYRHGVVTESGRTRPFTLPEEYPLIK